VVKIGRTHLEDAVPLTVGQEWSGYAGALDDAIAEVEHATAGLLALAMGGTAVGTGLNAPPGFGDQVAAQIARMTGAPYVTAPNKFTAQGTLDRMVRAHAGLKAAAVSLFKIANDLRWLGSGPRTGLGELIFPANEPGSSIMPGKVNPTQAEAMPMVAIQVIASDVAVTMGGNEGNFELNAFRPILISNYLHSALIMADMCDHFRQFMVEGTQLNQARLKENIDRSVMMVTALSRSSATTRPRRSPTTPSTTTSLSRRRRWPRACPRICTTRSSSPSTSPAPAQPTCPPDTREGAGPCA